MEPRSYDHAPRLPDEGPIELAAAAPGDGPLLLEVGSGRGLFARDFARGNPAWRVLAIEIRLKYAALLAERFAREKLARARCYAGDARALLERLGPDGGVDAVAVHFPDPWWKKRHAKRLVVGDEFVRSLARVVRPGGTVLVQTDVPERAEEYRARLLAEGSGFALAEPSRALTEVESPFAPARSNREVRAIADGLPIYRVVLRRA